jgi:hypothetical protein
MEDKLARNDYNSIADIQADVRLLYTNAVLFNGEDHELTAMAKSLSNAILQMISEVTKSRQPVGNYQQELALTNLAKPSSSHHPQFQPGQEGIRAFKRYTISLLVLAEIYSITTLSDRTMDIFLSLYPNRQFPSYAQVLNIYALTVEGSMLRKYMVRALAYMLLRKTNAAGGDLVPESALGDSAALYPALGREVLAMLEWCKEGGVEVGPPSLV